MSRAFGLPAPGQPMPEGISPATDICSDCGDFLAWCPLWIARWPDIERYRDE